MNDSLTPPAMPSADLSRDEKIALYRRMVLIRKTEEVLALRYREQEMRTPSHFGVGQEAVAAGVCMALNEKDAVYSHHRCHNHYLGCGGDVFQLAAELYGREGGCALGRGGSVHLTARSKGFVVSTAILGQTVPLAVGSALAFKMDGAPQVGVTFFGDAACEEGVIYESLNFASVHQLPVLFVCENNLYSTESLLGVRQAPGTRLVERAESFKVPGRTIDGNDLFGVHSAAREITARMRAGGGPFFLECNTYRWLEHVGPKFDYELGRTYRSREELEAWMARCPVLLAGRRLVEDGIASPADLEAWQSGIQDEVEAAVLAAKSSPWPNPAELFRHID